MGSDNKLKGALVTAKSEVRTLVSRAREICGDDQAEHMKKQLRNGRNVT